VLASALVVVAQTTGSNKGDKADAVVHGGKTLAEWVEVLDDDNPGKRSERDSTVCYLRNKLQEKDPEFRVGAALALASAGVADPVVVKILDRELWKEDGSGREMDAIRALAKIAPKDPQARAVVEEALHAEWDTMRAVARAAMQDGRQ
jgi:hypothetical protein